MEQRNTLLALALSAVVLIGWQILVMGPKIEEERQRAALEQQQTTAANPVAGQQAASAPDVGTPAAQAPDVEGAAAPALPLGAGREEALQANPRVPIESDAVIGSINLRGGFIDDLKLKRYNETLNDDSDIITLFSPKGANDAYYANVGWAQSRGAGVAIPGDNTIWTLSEGSALGPNSPVTISWDNGQGLTFSRTISLDENYMFALTQSVTNTSDRPVTLYPYGLISRTNEPVTSGIYILHEGLIGVLGEDGLQEVDYDDLRDSGRIDFTNLNDGWLGITDKYWAAALLPQMDQPYRAEFRADTRGADVDFVAAYLGGATSVPAGGSAETTNRIFAGAKSVALIDGYEAEYNLRNFDLLIDWGWFYFLTKPLFKVLDYFFQLVGNFGVSILIVTVLIKLVFFPLANKSYASMSKMKKVQPELKALQERHKDDRMELQQQMMKLYKKEGINPLSGCWPILIQIPVFFALYKVLFVTIEMRHAPFFGWVQDLSAKDPTSMFNLFGLLPFAPPEFLIIGIWPLLMGITMFVQMKLNPAPQDPTQAMIFTWMPIFFTFILASFPAGLVIYWTWNNFLSILQQSAIMKRHGVPIELLSNIKGSFGTKKSSE